MLHKICYCCSLSLFLMFLSVGGSYAADSTSFNPLPIAIESQGVGVPVGTIITWPVAQDPSDIENWLECNGQSVSQSVYPELFALVGGRVPDFRGLFLRGIGGNSAALGQTQGDAIRNIAGEFSAHHSILGGGSGVFKVDKAGGVRPDSGHEGGYYYMKFDASRVVPTADENRPVNKAVRYFVRAKQ